MQHRRSAQSSPVRQATRAASSHRVVSLPCPLLPPPAPVSLLPVFGVCVWPVARAAFLLPHQPLPVSARDRRHKKNTARTTRRHTGGYNTYNTPVECQYLCCFRPSGDPRFEKLLLFFASGRAELHVRRHRDAEGTHACAPLPASAQHGAMWCWSGGPLCTRRQACRANV
jgi:hypothetical protein